MSMEGGQRLDAWTGNGRETFTENVSLLKEAEAKAHAKVVFGLRVLYRFIYNPLPTPNPNLTIISKLHTK